MKCRKCPAEIIWIENERTGRAMPLNARPHPQGNVEIVKRPDNKKVGRVYGPGALLDKKRGENVSLYLNHFADCPFSKTFRKARA